MAWSATQLAEVTNLRGRGRGVFTATADAVHLRPSRLSPDNWRFERKGGDRLNVDRDDPMFVDHPKCPDTTLVDAQRKDVDTVFESGRARVDTRNPQVLELLAGACPLAKVHNPRGVRPDLRVDVEHMVRDNQGFEAPSLLAVLDQLDKDNVNKVGGVSVGLLLTPFGKRGVDLLDGLQEELRRGALSDLEERRVCGLGDVGSDVPIPRQREEGTHPLLPGNLGEVGVGCRRDTLKSSHQGIVLLQRA